MDPIGVLRDRFKYFFDDRPVAKPPTPSMAREIDPYAIPISRTMELHTLHFVTATAPRAVAKPVATAVVSGRLYTQNPKEVGACTTTPTPRDVVAILKEKWLQLSDAGARTLAAQFMGETGNGRFCFNWNLGNEKATPAEPHYFLRDVWEVESPARAARHVADSNGLARLSTPEETRTRGWSCPAGKEVVVYEPPHAETRFRAYDALGDGAQKWIARYQRTATHDPTFLPALNAGDTAAVAHALKRAGYYSDGETHYAASMAHKKAELDRTLGPAL
jgi:hypothetical protein